MRKLATIEEVQSLEPILDADRIELAKIRGWNVVVQKGLYEVGDQVVYFEIDSMLDIEMPQFQFLAERGVRTDADGFKGHVVKTMRLRGQYSQGLAIPVSEFELSGSSAGDDVTGLLGVRKWEPPIPASLSGQVRGKLPSWVHKTDSERIQNCEYLFPLEDVVATEKVDGSSATYSLHQEEGFHVCSRNLSLYRTDGNTFWNVADRLDIENLLQGYLSDSGTLTVTVQGELFGEGIQSNRLGVKGHRFAAFNFEVDGIPQDIPPEFEAVPKIDSKPPASLSEALEAVDGMMSHINPKRLAEGLVWRLRDNQPFHDGNRTVKAISNKYLLKEKE